jgi:hypothetical protein
VRSEPEGHAWRVVLRCPSCGWSAEQVLDEETVEQLDRELDWGNAELAVALEHMTHANMVEYVDCFTAALAANAILPEDF